MKKILFIFVLFCSSIFAQEKPYVLLISLDGFRWDYLNRGLTPNIQSVIDEGVHAISLRPVFPSKTFPNHISIVTGMYPENHGIISNGFENPFSGDYYTIGNNEQTKNAEWYLGEAVWETLERNNITTASYFWPGTPLNLEYRTPSYFENYEHNRPYKTRIEGIINWLRLPEEKRPHFMTFYFHDTDSYGHEFGPNSPELNKSIQRVDTLIGLVRQRINDIGMANKVNIIIVSDHGMTEVSPEKSINVDTILAGMEYKLHGSGPVMMVETDDKETVYNKLKANEEYFKVYTKNKIPEYFHYSKHPFIHDIILVAEINWSLVDNAGLEKYGPYKGGTHGFEKDLIDMHGIFVAAGPLFREGFRTGTLWNIDIYPLICSMFKIEPRSNIDGSLERIGFILK